MLAALILFSFRSFFEFNLWNVFLNSNRFSERRKCGGGRPTQFLCTRHKYRFKFVFITSCGQHACAVPYGRFVYGSVSRKPPIKTELNLLNHTFSTFRFHEPSIWCMYMQWMDCATFSNRIHARDSHRFSIISNESDLIFNLCFVGRSQEMSRLMNTLKMLVASARCRVGRWTLETAK